MMQEPQIRTTAGAGLARLDALESELFTLLDLGDSHQRRASRSSAECNPHRRRHALVGSDRDEFSNERGMTRHQELDCTDEGTVEMLTRKSLRFFTSDADCNIRSSHCEYKSATPLEVAWSALVRGKSDTDLRVIVTWDVASVTNLIIHAEDIRRWEHRGEG